jgi:DNA-binding phage protein
MGISMTKRDKSYEENLMKSLLDPEEAAAYIDAVLELKDEALLLMAQGQVERARDTKWPSTKSKNLPSQSIRHKLKA